MVVHLGAPVSHVVNTNDALVHAEQSRHMLVLLGAPVSHTISTNEALVLAKA